VAERPQSDAPVRGQPRRVETVIVGAGVSGLGCARRLLDAGRDFVVVSPSVGGRILQSTDGEVPLGAFYARADNDHIKEFVTLGPRIRGRTPCVMTTRAPTPGAIADS